MLHVIHRLVNNRGEVSAEWDFRQTSLRATVMFIIAVIKNYNRNDVRYVIDIALPYRED